MKKVFSLTLLMVLALSVASFAAAKTAPAQVPAPAPVQAVSTGGDAWTGKMAIGFVGLPGIPVPPLLVGGAGTPSFMYHFNKDVMGTVGGNYYTTGGANTTILFGKVDYVLATMGSVQSIIGGYIISASTGGASGTSLGGTWGVRTLVQQNLSLGADIIVLSSTSIAGTSTTGVLAGTIISLGYYF